MNTSDFLTCFVKFGKKLLIESVNCVHSVIPVFVDEADPVPAYGLN